MIDVQKGNSFVVACMNFDGGFGCIPGAESHGGQIFCCVGALALGLYVCLICALYVCRTWRADLGLAPVPH